MASKTTNIHVKDSADAFNVAARFMPGDWEDDRQASARAGYPVYRCYGDGLYYNYICDLGNRLEVNLGDGSTVNVWIDDDAEEDFTAAPAAAAPAAVADGDGLQEAATSSPVQSSAVAGATPAGSSDSAAGDPDLVTLRLRRSDVCRVSSALLGVKFDFIEEALPLPVDDPRRGVCIRSARAWDALRQEVRRQLQEHDARRGCGVDPWEVA